MLLEHPISVRLGARHWLLSGYGSFTIQSLKAWLYGSEYWRQDLGSQLEQGPSTREFWRKDATVIANSSAQLAEVKDSRETSSLAPSVL